MPVAEGFEVGPSVGPFQAFEAFLPSRAFGAFQELGELEPMAKHELEQLGPRRPMLQQSQQRKDR